MGPHFVRPTENRSAIPPPCPLGPSAPEKKKMPTLAEVLTAYTAHRGKLRSIQIQCRAFELHVLPVLGAVPVTQLRRSQLAHMLDQCALRSGPVAASRTLAYLRAALNWFAIRTDDWQPPLVRGMSQAWPGSKPRERVLSDYELRSLWAATDDAEPFSRIVRALMLTGQRRTEVSGMQWPELSGLMGAEPQWRIPPERFKSGREHLLPLTIAVLPLLGKRGAHGPFVFSTTQGRRPFSGYGRCMDRLRRRGISADFTLHDIRRTVRTRMAGLRVPDHVAELVIGHGKRGLQRVYDQHRYLPEMREALDAWAGELARIVGQN